MPRPRKYTTAWEGPTGRVKIEITHTEEYFNGRDHIEVRTLSPRNALLPITQTGYLSHFISATELAKAGGPRRYVDRLLIEGAKSPTWKRHVARLSQPDLFHWADAEPEGASGTPPPKRRTRPDRPSKIKPKRGQPRPSPR